MIQFKRPHPHPGFAHLLPSREKAIEPRTLSVALLPLWEKVPEGRMRGMLLTPEHCHAR
jgi:hypothetical protein